MQVTKELEMLQWAVDSDYIKKKELIRIVPTMVLFVGLGIISTIAIISRWGISSANLASYIILWTIPIIAAFVLFLYFKIIYRGNKILFTYKLNNAGLEIKDCKKDVSKFLPWDNFSYFYKTLIYEPPSESGDFLGNLIDTFCLGEEFILVKKGGNLLKLERIFLYIQKDQSEKVEKFISKHISFKK